MHKLLAAAALLSAIAAITPAQAEGAFAASRDGKTGISYNYRSRGDAEERALQECGGRGCQIVGHFHGMCGAIASGREGGYGYAWAEGRRAAEERAIDNCRSEGGRGCSVSSRGCDDR